MLGKLRRKHFFGDYGAHPQDDGIDSVDKEEASRILEFAKTVLGIAYVTPWKIAKLRA